MRLERYKYLLALIDSKKNKISIIKFLKKDNKLYMYDFYLPKENQELLEVKSINGIEISSIINKANESDFYDDYQLRQFNIDTSKSYEITFTNGKTIDLLDENIESNIFYKNHDINEILEMSEDVEIKETEKTNNTMLDYASTNIKSLLIIISKMLKSDKDKELFQNLFINFNEVNDNYNSVNENLDILLLSTELLLLGDKINNIPNYLELAIKNSMSFDFGSEDIRKTNNSILTEGKIDYKKLIIMIRNCIAHSNYKILEDGRIKFYNEGKNKLEVIATKNNITKIFNYIFNYHFLEGVYPLIYLGTYNNDNAPFNKNTINDFLDKIEVYDLGNYQMKQSSNREKQDNLDTILPIELAGIKEISTNNIYNTYMDKEAFERKTKELIKNHLIIEEEPHFKSLTQEDINFIFNNISELGEDYFYSLSQSSQIEVINNLIYQKYAKEYYIQKNIQDIISTNHYSNDSLKNKASKYINYKTKLELLITTLLNNIFLFCYNQNKSNQDASSIIFPMTIYNDYLESKVSTFYNITTEAQDYKVIYNILLKSASTHAFQEEDFELIDDKIKETRNRLYKLRNDISMADNITANKYKPEELEKVNQEILKRIRDCLAHGRLKVELNSINSIAEARIEIIDEYNSQVLFETTITLEELLNTINNQDFINSILNNNKNFENHKTI